MKYQTDVTIGYCQLSELVQERLSAVGNSPLAVGYPYAIEVTIKVEARFQSQGYSICEVLQRNPLKFLQPV